MHLDGAEKTPIRKSEKFSLQDLYPPMMSTFRPCGASSSMGRQYFTDLAPGLPDEEWQWAETHRASAHCIGHLQDTSICH
jgi:hypothetical protein